MFPISDFRNAANSYRFLGRRFRDPICGHGFRHLITSDTGAIDAICPRCWSAERHRTLWLYLTRETGITTRAARLLHVAPERGISTRLRRLANIEYVSADVDHARAMIAADLTALPFSDGVMDIILCSHVLEHVADDRTAMREMRRVLAPGGFAVMQHPVDDDRPSTFEDWTANTPEARETLFFQSDHVRIYGRDLKDRLEAAGFRVVVVRYLDKVSHEDRRRFRLDQVPGTRPERDLEADRIYLCHKDG